MRLAGIAYLVYFALAGAGVGLKSTPLNIAGTAFYFVLFVLIYRFFAPVDPLVALAMLPIAALACAVQGVGQLQSSSELQRVALVIFGVNLVLLGYLVARSGFAPSTLGYVLAVAGIGWCAAQIPGTPPVVMGIVFLFGAISEGVFAFWLLFGS